MKINHWVELFGMKSEATAVYDLVISHIIDEPVFKEKDVFWGEYTILLSFVKEIFDHKPSEDFDFTDDDLVYELYKKRYMRRYED